MTDLLPEKGLTLDQIAARVDAVLAQASLTEKIGMMSGQGFFAAYKEDGGLWAARPYRAGGGIERLGVPAFWFTDGPRGAARGNSTCFPCTMARGASFDIDLERRIGEAMAIEIRAQGCNLSGAVCINLLRHPAWGRAQETYGEDPQHLGAMGSALGQGLQAHNVCATVKHFALNSMENTRFKVNVSIDDRALHEVYLPHFKACIDAGVASVMSAYNLMNGEYCGQHTHLLTDILRGEWGFTGFVHSDWVMGVYKPYGATAGLDVENPEPLVFGPKLLAAVEAGTIAPHVIDTACRRILMTLYRFASAQDPLPEYPMSLVASSGHVALALEAAEKSAVLLRNDGVLPLDPARLRRLAVLGRLACLENTGDNGSSRVRPPHIVTPLAGLAAALGADRIVTGDETDIPAAVEAAAGADAAIIVTGYTAREEGEFIPGDFTLGQDDAAPVLPDEVKQARKRRPHAIGGDRTSLDLSADQVALINAVAATGTPVIVVIIAGSAVMVEAWHDTTAAILQTFYAGMEGGTALARLLTGAVSPSGRLPFTVARDAGDYPFFDRDAVAITYDHWHGYALLAHDSKAARYAFGHGLSYARFEIRALGAHRSEGMLDFRLAVTNHGAVAGDHVVLLWAEPPGGVSPCWQRRLAGFARISLAPGETGMAQIRVPLAALRHRTAARTWQLEQGNWRFVIADNAEASAAQGVTVLL
ncbi:glycoside hydrolase family 3 C-terminal domain-containing protein [Sandarakinorhabdus sp.]|uniref:glycoside hydrolase family 3 protein n=1 Tax=Sandarakinorhabdus sp. TaxID=1916663 RepID=UPI00286E994A|nr:glycoside hydrolase family 3 C-terminal domain-containing protein [Sandarakinorhabdus sp.]